MAQILGRTRALPWNRSSREDSVVAERARSALAAVLGAAAADLTLQARHGVITLRGEVDRLADIEAYARIVRDVPGVADVDNLLRLRLAGWGRPRVITV